MKVDESMYNLYYGKKYYKPFCFCYYSPVNETFSMMKKLIRLSLWISFVWIPGSTTTVFSAPLTF